MTRTPALDQLEILPRDQLMAFWLKAHGTTPPKAVGIHLLKLSAAYYLQTRGITKKTKAIETRLLHKNNKGRDRSLSLGTILVRQWHGRSYKVEILEKGVLLGDQKLKSLTAAATYITGTKQSGPLFFGLKQRNPLGGLKIRVSKTG
jgi:hypothetical protein